MCQLVSCCCVHTSAEVWRQASPHDRPLWLVHLEKSSIIKGRAPSFGNWKRRYKYHPCVVQIILLHREIITKITRKDNSILSWFYSRPILLFEYDTNIVILVLLVLWICGNSVLCFFWISILFSTQPPALRASSTQLIEVLKSISIYAGGHLNFNQIHLSGHYQFD